MLRDCGGSEDLPPAVPGLASWDTGQQCLHSERERGTQL